MLHCENMTVLETKKENGIFSGATFYTDETELYKHYITRIRNIIESLGVCQVVSDMEKSQFCWILFFLSI